MCSVTLICQYTGLCLLHILATLLLGWKSSFVQLDPEFTACKDWALPLHFCCREFGVVRLAYLKTCSDVSFHWLCIETPCPWLLESGQTCSHPLLLVKLPWYSNILGKVMSIRKWQGVLRKSLGQSVLLLVNWRWLATLIAISRFLFQDQRVLLVFSLIWIRCRVSVFTFCSQSSPISVAVKELHSCLSSNTGMVESFTTEALVLGQFRHCHVINLIGIVDIANKPVRWLLDDSSMLSLRSHVDFSFLVILIFLQFLSTDSSRYSQCSCLHVPFVCEHKLRWSQYSSSTLIPLAVVVECHTHVVLARAQSKNKFVHCMALVIGAPILCVVFPAPPPLRSEL